MKEPMTNNKHKEIMERFDERYTLTEEEINDGWSIDMDDVRNFLSSALTEQLEEIERWVESIERDLKARMAHPDHKECVTCDETLYHIKDTLSHLHSKKEII